MVRGEIDWRAARLSFDRWRKMRAQSSCVASAGDRDTHDSVSLSIPNGYTATALRLGALGVRRETTPLSRNVRGFAAGRPRRATQSLTRHRDRDMSVTLLDGAHRFHRASGTAGSNRLAQQ